MTIHEKSMMLAPFFKELTVKVIEYMVDTRQDDILKIQMHDIQKIIKPLFIKKLEEDKEIAIELASIAIAMLVNEKIEKDLKELENKTSRN